MHQENETSAATPTATCEACAKSFTPRFRYQVREEAGRFVYVCSARCQAALLTSNEATCSACESRFEVDFPWQIDVRDGSKRYYCTRACREAGPKGLESPEAGAGRRLAVFNHKGGTGKTTTAINLAAGFAQAGERVLLVDADGQGNVGASLGVRGERGLYHVLVQGSPVADVVVPVRPNLDVLTSNEALAAAELNLAGRPDRDRVLRQALGSAVSGYDRVVIDCAPALSLMNQNALVFADSVLVPVACDYLSLVGVKQVLRTLKHVHAHLQHDVSLLGVLPTFYDVRNRISRDALGTLRQHFGTRCLSPIRVNTRLREAPSKRKTIFEHAPTSHGAEDYRAAVAAVRRDLAEAAARTALSA